MDKSTDDGIRRVHPPGRRKVFREAHRVEFVMEREEWEAIKRKCEKMDVSYRAFVRRALRELLERIGG